ncbi:MAG: 4'-phosphopantetheinyl transferase superfamily protein [Candidatus Omnitrophica bacterium]|nr:4'-phosphopantetheinyl transferase superfamily protein [Candidatus Omnitrophota bacterium]
MVGGRFSLLGIDLVEIKKARVFYRNHKKRLRSFFSPEEAEYIRRGEDPPVNLARVLAAKEAVFKAVRRPAMGPALFDRIRVVPQRRGIFGCRVREGRSRPKTLEISFVRGERYVVARCVGIS